MAKKSNKKQSNIKLSATRINVFLQCKLKYKFNYIDYLPRLSSLAFALGTAVHETLEFAGGIWMEKQSFSDSDIESIIDCYNKVAVKEGIYNLSIYKEGLEMIRRRIEEFVFSGEKLIGLEQKFGMGDAPDVITKRGVPLIGAIDRVSLYEDSTIVVSDYKTLTTAPTTEDIKNDIQLSLYDVAANILYPDYKRIILSLDLLRHEPIYTYRTDQEREDFDKYLKSIYDAMVSFDPAVDAVANLNFLCAWCDYKDSCEAYVDACKKTNYRFLELQNMKDEHLFEEWDRVRSVEKVLSSRKKEVASLIIDRIKDDNIKVSNDNEEIYIRQNSRVDYDVNKLYNIIPSDDFVSMISVKKTALDNYVKQNPAFKKAVESSATINFNEPFIAKRKVKSKKK
jgi:putative RecB family exonuclease